MFLNLNNQEALNYKNDNKIDYQTYNLAQLNKLHKLTGVYEFHLSKDSFKILCVNNDDSSVVKAFWQNSHDLNSLNLWYDCCSEEGIYIDVGAHTGLYTMAALKSNSQNYVIPIEPYYLNMARLITNLRLNNLEKNIKPLILAVSDKSGTGRFNLNTSISYLSKGGKIDNSGTPINIIKLDELDFSKVNKPIKGIKIDTEGEDFKILVGAKKIISEYKPKIIIEVRNENKKNIKDFLKNYNYITYLDSNLLQTVDLEKINFENVINIFSKPA